MAIERDARRSEVSEAFREERRVTQETFRLATFLRGKGRDTQITVRALPMDTIAGKTPSAFAINIENRTDGETQSASRYLLANDGSAFAMRPYGEGVVVGKDIVTTLTKKLEEHGVPVQLPDIRIRARKAFVQDVVEQLTPVVSTSTVWTDSNNHNFGVRSLVDGVGRTSQVDVVKFVESPDMSDGIGFVFTHTWAYHGNGTPPEYMKSEFLRVVPHANNNPEITDYLEGEIQRRRTKLDEDRRDGLTKAYPERAREGVEILQARAETVAVAVYEKNLAQSVKGIFSQDSVASAQVQAVGILYNGGLGKSTAEIADVLRIPEGEVRASLFSAKIEQ